MRRIFSVILLVCALLMPAFAQRENTFYVRDFFRDGGTVADALTAAQSACNSDTMIPCIVVLDPTLARYPQGVTPERCAQCVWQDFRQARTLRNGVASFAELQQDVTACSGLPCSVFVNSDLTIASNFTVPENVLLIAAGGTLKVAAGVTLEIDFTPTAPLKQFIDVSASASAVKFGPRVNLVPVEWLGGKADWNGTTGTDNVFALQHILDGLTVGQVKISGLYKACGLEIKTPQVGIKGDGIGTGLAAVSGLVCNSATATILKVTANQYKLQDFAVGRSVLPTGTLAAGTAAVGIDILNAGGGRIERVASHDSLQNFRFKGAPYYGSGAIAHNVADWEYDWTGHGAISGYTNNSTNPRMCYFLDSRDGTPSPSFVMDAKNVCALPVGSATVVSYGFAQIGNFLSDTFISKLEVAGVTVGIYGEVVGGSAGSPGYARDIQYFDNVLDGCDTGFKFVGNRAGGGYGVGSEYVSFSRNWVVGSTRNLAYAIDVSDASGINIGDNQIFAQTGGGIYLHNGVIGFTVHDNFVYGWSNAAYSALRFDAVGPGTSGNGNGTCLGNYLQGAGPGIYIDASSYNIGCFPNTDMGVGSVNLSATSFIRRPPVVHAKRVAGCTASTASGSTYYCGPVTLAWDGGGFGTTDYTVTCTAVADATHNAWAAVYNKTATGVSLFGYAAAMGQVIAEFNCMAVLDSGF